MQMLPTPMKTLHQFRYSSQKIMTHQNHFSHDTYIWEHQPTCTRIRSFFCTRKEFQIPTKVFLGDDTLIKVVGIGQTRIYLPKEKESSYMYSMYLKQHKTCSQWEQWLMLDCKLGLHKHITRYSKAKLKSFTNPKKGIFKNCPWR